MNTVFIRFCLVLCVGITFSKSEVYAQGYVHDIEIYSHTDQHMPLSRASSHHRAVHMPSAHFIHPHSRRWASAPDQLEVHPHALRRLPRLEIQHILHREGYRLISRESFTLKAYGTEYHSHVLDRRGRRFHVVLDAYDGDILDALVLPPLMQHQRFAAIPKHQDALKSTSIHPFRPYGRQMPA
jgi:hypothetical protein